MHLTAIERLRLPATVACAACIAVAPRQLDAQSPAEMLRQAAADLETQVAPADRGATRYVSLYNLPLERRRQAAAVVSFVLNSVSRTERIALPTPAPGSAGGLLRLNLNDYAIDRDLWEALAARDPYWHVTTKAIDPRGGKPTTVQTDGGWVGLETAARLRTLTASRGAVVRADYFVVRAATTADGGLYYELAGVPRREREFFQEIGLDLAEINRLRADRGANLLDSNVTREVRRVVRRQGPLGGAWHTYDVATSTAERDPLRNPFAFEYDAGEHIAARPNGLHWFALYDRRGARQDSVPDTIAKDTTDAFGAGAITPMLSCVRCHVEDGLRPFLNDQRRLLAGGVELFAERPADARRLAAFYDTDLARETSRDREDYAEVVGRATGGLGVRDTAAALAWLYDDFVHQQVALDRAAREVGCQSEDLRARLRGSFDPVLLALAEGMSVQREQWEASFAEAALAAASP